MCRDGAIWIYWQEEWECVSKRTMTRERVGDGDLRGRDVDKAPKGIEVKSVFVT